MLSKKGFTLVESLFVITIMMVMTLLSVNTHPFSINVDNHLNTISLFLLEAKTHAMIYKEDVNISFYDNCIDVSSIHLNKQFEINEGIFTKHNFSYNKLGHIVNPKSIHLIYNNQKYTFVFQIGAGCFYVQK